MKLRRATCERLLHRVATRILHPLRSAPPEKALVHQDILGLVVISELRRVRVILVFKRPRPGVFLWAIYDSEEKDLFSGNQPTFMLSILF